MLILASRSASRAAMLAAAGVPFAARPADVDERALEAGLGHAPAADVALALARAKARAVTAPEAWVLGSDSLVEVAGRRFAKPGSREEAAAHLSAFSGRDMHLHSAAALVRDGVLHWSHADRATLRVRALSDAFIAHYLDAEWPAVAGCVGVFRIEGPGVQLFEHIEGDHFTVLGMPLLAVLAALRQVRELPGMTRPYAEVIGDPIAQSKSPLIHNFWLEKLGIDAEYRACHVRAEELADYFANRREDAEWRGCNVTMPHKLAVLGLVDGVEPAAKVAGAVNTVFKVGHNLGGANTDLRGFAEPFRDQHINRGTALLLGTGGAARAIFVALAALGFSPIKVAGRDVQRAQVFLASLGQANAIEMACAMDEPIPPVDLLVNATSLGMAGADPFDPDLSELPATAIVYDIVYSPLETALLRQARMQGLQTIDGLTMLIGQAGHAFRHFFADPPRQHDAELRTLLTA